MHPDVVVCMSGVSAVRDAACTAENVANSDGEVSRKLMRIYRQKIENSSANIGLKLAISTQVFTRFAFSSYFANWLKCVHFSIAAPSLLMMPVASQFLATVVMGQVQVMQLPIRVSPMLVPETSDKRLVPVGRLGGNPSIKVFFNQIK